MYIVTKDRTTWMRVEFDTLDPDGAKRTESFRMKVVLVQLEEFEKLLLMVSGQGGDVSPLDFISNVARDWDEIVGEDKKPFPFTADNLGIVMRQPGFLLGWQLSYIRAWNGQPAEREKNSEGSPVDGPAGAGNRAERRAGQSRQKRSLPKPASKPRKRS